MNKLLRSEKGISLIEVLAVLVISSVIFMFATSLIVQAMNSQDRITAEAQLRDEADIIMAKLMKSIFTLKESEILKVECGTMTNTVTTLVSCMTDSTSLTPDQATEVTAAKEAMNACSTTAGCRQFAYIILKNNEKIGFSNGTVVIRDEQYKIEMKDVTLQPYYTLESKSSNYNVSGRPGESISIVVAFQLMNEKKQISHSFKNEIVTVDDE